MVVYTCNLSTGKLKQVAGGTEVQGHPCLHNEFKYSLWCVKPCLKTENKNKQDPPLGKHPLFFPGPLFDGFSSLVVLAFPTTAAPSHSSSCPGDSHLKIIFTVIM